MSNDKIFLYHGTDNNSANLILTNGIEERPLRPGLDFGSGFYTTTLKRQAEKWANIMADMRSRGGASSPKLEPRVIIFEATYRSLAKLENLSFATSGYDADDFWRFVLRMKSGAYPDHDQFGVYSLVSGQLTIRPGKKTRHIDSDQFSFHGEQGMLYINSLPRTLVRPISGREF